LSDSKIALTFSDRANLYERIDHRVDKMMSEGLEDEVRVLLQMNVPHNNTSMQAIGYKEISIAIKEKTDISLAVEKIKMESRRYAKRQLTWFRRDNNIKWIVWDKSPDFNDGVRYIMEQLNEKK